MFGCLSPDAIGIRGANLQQGIQLAAEAGFEGIAFSIGEASEIAGARGLRYLRELFESTCVVPGTWGLPVVWNRSDEEWRRDLAALPSLAALGRDLGCTCTSTWCPPGSNERDYDQNFAWHVERFRPIALVLAENGCRLGIEFIGPKTSRAQLRYPFIHTLSGMMDLAQAIGTGNVGLLLDAWHLHTSGGSLKDLDAIAAEDVVVVHVNDAPVGVARDEQIDNVRRLPMETGVIDLVGLMRKLAHMGYAGPVVPEPFSLRVNELAAKDPLGAARVVSDSMTRMWEAADLA